MARCIFLDSTGSTNLYLLDLLDREDLEDFFSVFTEHQTAGRGRMNRSWTCNTGVALSVFLKNNLPAKYVNWLPLVVGLAVTNAVNKMLEDEKLSYRATIKWPNDILIGNKKLSGILIETHSRGLVIGIGLNTKESPLETSICLRQLGLGMRQIAVDVVVQALLRELRDACQRLVEIAVRGVSFKTSELFFDILSACSTMNKLVRVTGQTVLVGVAQGFDSLGRLIIRDGEDTAIVSAGNIEHLRTL